MGSLEWIGLRSSNSLKETLDTNCALDCCDSAAKRRNQKDGVHTIGRGSGAVTIRCSVAWYKEKKADQSRTKGTRSILAQFTSTAWPGILGLRTSRCWMNESHFHSGHTLPSRLPWRISPMTYKVLVTHQNIPSPCTYHAVLELIDSVSVSPTRVTDTKSDTFASPQLGRRSVT